MLFLLSLPLLAMPEEDYTLLKEQLEEASFNSDKLSTLELAAQHNTFTCDQVAEIIGQLSFDSDQLEALNILASRIEDPSRTFVILKVFSFQSSRKKAEAILSAKAPKQSLQERQEAERRRKEAEISAEKKRKEELKRKKREQRILKEEGPTMRWVGRCKRSDTCLNFNADLFAPIYNRKKHQRWPNHKLLLQVTGPGVLDVNITLGKKFSCKSKTVNRRSNKRELTHHIQLNPGLQVVDVTALVPDWKRQYVDIMATKDNMGTYLKLTKWKKCD